jgi:8-oxo-dGTP pyrophosphatase MutT (NUDIX family)
MSNILDVFNPRLLRGAERSSFDPEKRYAYVEHPTEGWRVYLRSGVFLHPLHERFRPQQFLVVKRTGARMSSPTWEPPKGQMEGKDMTDDNTIMELLENNVRRETEEEAHITDISHLRYTRLVFQGREKNYPPNTFFQYHIFQGFVTPEQVAQSFETFEWIKEHPKGFQRWRRDRKEKDAVAWFNPRQTRLNPRWCPDIAALYLQFIKTPLYH